MPAAVERFIQRLGDPGNYQILIAALLCSNYFPPAFHHLAVTLYTRTPPHNCRLPDGWPWHKQFSIPKIWADGVNRYDECRMYVDPNALSAGTKPCVYGWEFHPQGREWTVVAEWGLVCERQYLTTLVSAVYACGVIFGGLVFGTLADKFGRKPAMLLALYAQTAIALAIYFCTNFVLFVILRFFHGFVIQGLQCVTFCLLMELLPQKTRPLAGIGCFAVWSLGSIVLAAVSSTVQHWRYIQLAISLPSVVTLTYAWLIPESIRWLLTIAKTDEAWLISRKLSNINKTNLEDGWQKELESLAHKISDSEVYHYGMKEIFLHGPMLRLSSLILAFCWFCCVLMYHGLSLIAPDTTGDQYGNLAVMGFMELIGISLMFCSLRRFGLKRSLCAVLIISGAICVSAVVADNVDNANVTDSGSASVSVSVLQRASSLACLAVLAIYAVEAFPTVIRCFAFGVCLFCGQIGWIVAPQVMKLGHYTMKSIPSIVFGALALLAGFLVILLPDTKGQPLPDSLDEAEFGRRRSKERRDKTTPKDSAKKNGGKEDSIHEGSEGGGSNHSSITKSQANGVVWNKDGDSGSFHLMADNPSNVVTEEGETSASEMSEVADGEHSPVDWDQRPRVVRFLGMDERWQGAGYLAEAMLRKYDDEADADLQYIPYYEYYLNRQERCRPMVRFSFENEEFHINPKLPVNRPAKRRPSFTAIREEPELEEEAIKEQEEEERVRKLSTNSLQQCMQIVTQAGVPHLEPAIPNETENVHGRFTVTPVNSGQRKLGMCQPAMMLIMPPSYPTMTAVTQRSSRFTVTKVNEPQVPTTNRFTVTKVEDVPPENVTVAIPNTRFTVQSVPETSRGHYVKNLPKPKSSVTVSNRFTVKKVADPLLHPESEVIQNSRFSVQRVTEPESEMVQSSRFSVQRVPEPKSEMVQSSRFSVQRVPEPESEPIQSSRFNVQRAPERESESVQSSIFNVQRVPERESEPIQSSRFSVQRVSERESEQIPSPRFNIQKIPEPLDPLKNENELPYRTNSNPGTKVSDPLPTKPRFTVTKVPDFPAAEVFQPNPGSPNRMIRSASTKDDTRKERIPLQQTPSLPLRSPRAAVFPGKRISRFTVTSVDDASSSPRNGRSPKSRFQVQSVKEAELNDKDSALRVGSNAECTELQKIPFSTPVHNFDSQPTTKRDVAGSLLIPASSLPVTVYDQSLTDSGVDISEDHSLAGNTDIPSLPPDPIA